MSVGKHALVPKLSAGAPGASAAWVRALQLSAAARRRQDASLVACVTEHAAERPDSPALFCDGVWWSYGRLAQRIAQYAHWALERELKSADVVCLLMKNSPDLLAAWLGITRAGGTVALLNTSLSADGLAHCARTVSPRHVMSDDAHEAIRTSLIKRLGEGVTGWHLPAGVPVETFAWPPAPDPRQTALLIYTSGTTGLPKAARVSHGRIRDWSYWFAGMMDVRRQDRLFNCLPMYHSVGGVASIGAVLVGGGSAVIRDRFSSTTFWDDVIDFECTLFQYIGELCRYLLNCPPNPRERTHHLRLCCGNGLRSGVWEKFKERFAIPAILEFYASTEGNISLYNAEGHPGAIGRIPGFLAHRSGLALVELDCDSGEPLRSPDGRCLMCATGDAGEAIGRIVDGNFEGYTEADASEGKVLRDVFESGDAWFRTGDLMRRDAAGFYYFLDRLGDTFRWKGENVSTAEVAGVLAGCPGVIDSAVFGVIVPGVEGRAGMAALVTDERFEVGSLGAALQGRLPDYAKPLFLRLTQEIIRTPTFKVARSALAREGWAANEAGEPCYFFDRQSGRYVELDDARRTQIVTGMVL